MSQSNIRNQLVRSDIFLIHESPQLGNKRMKDTLGTMATINREPADKES